MRYLWGYQNLFLLKVAIEQLALYRSIEALGLAPKVDILLYPIKPYSFGTFVAILSLYISLMSMSTCIF